MNNQNENKCSAANAIRSYEKARQNLVNTFSQPVKVYPISVSYKNYDDGTENKTLKIFFYLTHEHRERAIVILQNKTKKPSDHNWASIKFKKVPVDFVNFYRDVKYLDSSDEYFEMRLCYYMSDSYINSIDSEAYRGTWENYKK